MVFLLIPQTFIKHTCGYWAIMFKPSPKVPNSPGEEVKYKSLAFALEAPLGSCDYPDVFLLVRWAFLLPALKEEEVRGREKRKLFQGISLRAESFIGDINTDEW